MKVDIVGVYENAYGKAYASAYTDGMLPADGERWAISQGLIAVYKAGYQEGVDNSK